MKSQAVLVSVALLGLCCLLIPRGGESAGGILSLSQAGDTLQDQSVDEPQAESLELAVDLVGRRTKHRRSTEEAVQEGKWWKFVLQLLNIQTEPEPEPGLIRPQLRERRQWQNLKLSHNHLVLQLWACPHLLAAAQGNKQERPSSLARTKVDTKTSQASCKQTDLFSTDSGLLMINVDCGAQSHEHN